MAYLIDCVDGSKSAARPWMNSARTPKSRRGYHEATTLTLRPSWPPPARSKASVTRRR